VRYDSTMSNFALYLSELPADDQQHLKRCMKMLVISLRSCETRVHAYEAGNIEPYGSTVIKLINNLKETVAVSEGMIDKLIVRHKLPDDLRHVSEELRKDFRDFLTGNA